MAEETERKSDTGVFDRIYALARLIPAGKCASYGMLASLTPGATPRIVGYAMAGAPDDVPWQRVINAGGAISPRPGAERQRAYLEAEGVTFNKRERIDWEKVRWGGPGIEWAVEQGMDVGEYLAIVGTWGRGYP